MRDKPWHRKLTPKFGRHWTGSIWLFYDSDCSDGIESCQIHPTWRADYAENQVIRKLLIDSLYEYRPTQSNRKTRGLPAVRLPMQRVAINIRRF